MVVNISHFCSIYFNFDELGEFESILPRNAEKGILGKAVEFLTPQNKLIPNKPYGRFFQENEDIGSFTIEFYFKH